MSKNKDTIEYWLISDTHFNHEKLTEWGERSGVWQENIWEGLKKIPAKDILIHLGDICIGNDLEIHEKLAELPCKKVLIRGNHDHKSPNWYLGHGWDVVFDGMHLEYMGHTLLLTHRPMHPDMWRFTRNIHGHTHGNMHRAEEYSEWYLKDYHIDISPELIGLKPIRLSTLIGKVVKN